MNARLLAIPLVTLCCAVPRAHGVDDSAERKFRTGSIIFLEGHEAGRSQWMECPNHAYGTQDQALGVLKDKIAHRVMGDTCFLQLCVSEQTESLKLFAPLAEFSSINPYSSSSATAPSAGAVVWPGVDHPLLNRVREMHEVAGDSVLLARLGLRGEEPGYFTTRPTVWEEFEWLFFAAIGGNFKGFVWMSALNDGSDRARRVKAMEAQFEPIGKDLYRARPVAWIKPASDVYASALANDHRLFIAVLNPQYMQPVTGDKRAMQVPLDPQPIPTTVQCELPAGIRAGEVRTLGGLSLPATRKDALLSIPFTLSHGGDLIVVKLEPSPNRK